MTKRKMDLVVSILASGISLALSWPFWRKFEFWAESETAWNIYFVVGFILAVYVFYVFLGSLRTLFDHDVFAREKEAETAKSNKGDV